MGAESTAVARRADRAPVARGAGRHPAIVPALACCLICWRRLETSLNENLWLLGSPRRSPTSRLATIDAAPRGCYGRRSVGITDEVAVSGERVSGRRLAVAALAIVFAIAAAAPSFAGAAKTRRVSVSSTGAEADDGSYRPAISPDGRFIAFISNATNLVSGDTNGFADVFVRDLKTHKTRRVSVSSAGAEGDGDSVTPEITADGRFVAFYSYATDLVGGDTNGFSDIFVRDQETHKTKRVSVSSAGAQGNDNVGGFPS